MDVNNADVKKVEEYKASLTKLFGVRGDHHREASWTIQNMLSAEVTSVEKELDDELKAKRYNEKAIMAEFSRKFQAAQDTRKTLSVLRIFKDSF